MDQNLSTELWDHIDPHYKDQRDSLADEDHRKVFDYFFDFIYDGIADDFLEEISNTKAKYRIILNDYDDEMRAIEDRFTSSLSEAKNTFSRKLDEINSEYNNNINQADSQFSRSLTNNENDYSNEIKKNEEAYKNNSKSIEDTYENDKKSMEDGKRSPIDEKWKDSKHKISSLFGDKVSSLGDELRQKLDEVTTKISERRIYLQNKKEKLSQDMYSYVIVFFLIVALVSLYNIFTNTSGIQPLIVSFIIFFLSAFVAIAILSMRYHCNKDLKALDITEVNEKDSINQKYNPKINQLNKYKEIILDTFNVAYNSRYVDDFSDKLDKLSLDIENIDLHESFAEFKPILVSTTKDLRITTEKQLVEITQKTNELDEKRQKSKKQLENEKDEKDRQLLSTKNNKEEQLRKNKDEKYLQFESTKNEKMNGLNKENDAEEVQLRSDRQNKENSAIEQKNSKDAATDARLKDLEEKHEILMSQVPTIVSDTDVDKIINNDIDSAYKLARKNMCITPDEANTNWLFKSIGLLQEEHPLLTRDYLYVIKIGKDSKIRYPVLYFTWYVSAGFKLIVFSCFYDVIKNKMSGLYSDEFFYSDVVSVSQRTKDKTIPLNEFNKLVVMLIESGVIDENSTFDDEEVTIPEVPILTLTVSSSESLRIAFEDNINSKILELLNYQKNLKRISEISNDEYESTLEKRDSFIRHIRQMLRQYKAIDMGV